jgi:uncharacterized membrane protein YfcA
MGPTLVIDPLYTLSGLIIGLIVGLTGVGGGSLMTPVLVLLFGIHPATAVGTDLLYAAVTKSAGTAMHGFNRAVDWRIVGRLATGSVPAAAATLALLHLTGAQSQGTGRLVSVVLGVMLVLTALTLFARPRLTAFAARRPDLPAGRQRLLTIATGVVLGVLVSISSVGAGAIGVSALMLLYPRLPVLRIIGSDIAHAVPLTLIAGLGHWMIGDVDPAILVSLLAGSVPGILVSSFLAPRFREDLLRLALGLILAIVGIRLFVG